MSARGAYTGNKSDPEQYMHTNIKREKNHSLNQLPLPPNHSEILQMNIKHARVHKYTHTNTHTHIHTHTHTHGICMKKCFGYSEL